LDDEIRVTVIATGFGTAKRQMIEKMEQPEPVDLFEKRGEMPFVSRIAGLDKPVTAEQLVTENAEAINFEDLEVPAFLRNRAR
jgi:cell division GTPase FtsZ